MHCNHHTYFHSGCAACHHVRSIHEDAEETQRLESTDWLTGYAQRIGDDVFDSTSSTFVDTASTPAEDVPVAELTVTDSSPTDTADSFDSFGGGDSGGSGASGDF